MELRPNNVPLLGHPLAITGLRRLDRFACVRFNTVTYYPPFLAVRLCVLDSLCVELQKGVPPTLRNETRSTRNLKNVSLSDSACGC